jgi:hypothetical protein
MFAYIECLNATPRTGVMLRDRISRTSAIVAAGLAIAAAAGIGALRTEGFVTRGFGKALEGSHPGLTFEVTAPTGQTDGDEGYWLTRAQMESATPFAKLLAVGDRITIAGADGRQRQLEVSDLKAIAPTRAGAARLLLVTCRIVGGTEREAGPVRFVVEAEAAEPAVAVPPKTL